ncbi:MAG TPA: aminoacyl-tRNA hydrolase [Anaerolineaceae bacterium]|nr:aminoacyl-tRNA hydrolase [Anaerolineaceae bacterium]HPN52898.1 aminoacyl-tRNA hydrolase [Anaerolineaceae bacterium]
MTDQTPLPEAELPFLIAGLGNPGREYRETRHNIGFMLVDELSQAWGFRLSRVQNKAIVTTGQFQGRRIILAKPQTYMNLSGQAISSLTKFYKVPVEHLIVAHDDLDLPLGTIRLRPGGGSAGQKGVSSTIEQLGTQSFPRLRLGIGRPPGRMDAADYVLENFLKPEKEILAQVLEHARKAVEVFILSGLNQAMNEFNGSLLKE